MKCLVASRYLRSPSRPSLPRSGSGSIRLVGMAFSNFVALSIMITVGATLHPAGITNIESSVQAAEALKPIAGSLAFALFALGIIGTGLLSIPVLAGSAAYALGEALKWKVGLKLQPTEGRTFYGTIAMATLIGVALNFTGINPIKALYYSAVINGVVAVPIIACMMLIASDKKVMGRFTVEGALLLSRLGDGWRHGARRHRDGRDNVQWIVAELFLGLIRLVGVEEPVVLRSHRFYLRCPSAGP